MVFENFLLLTSLLLDIIFPFLSMQWSIPSQLRFVSHLASLIIIGIGIIRFLRLPTIPVLFLGIFGWFILSIATALTNSQSILATIWGLYIWLRFPLIGLYAFTRPDWSDKLIQWFLDFPIILVGINLLVQLFQFLVQNIPAGDNLSGFFGVSGTGILACFIGLALSFEFGKWVVNGSYKKLLILVGLSLVSSLLGEMKVVLVLIPLISGLAVLAFYFYHRKILPVLQILLIGVIGIGVFIQGYSVVFPTRNSIIEIISDPTQIMNLLSIDRSFSTSYYGSERTITEVGRLYDLEAAFDQINQNPYSLLVGWGVGSRRESVSLGAVGEGLLLGNLGVYTGTSLAILVGEMGILGVILFAVLMGLLVRFLIVKFQVGSHQEMIIRVGLIIFAFTLPFLMFYADVWSMTSSMFMFWISIGVAYHQEWFPSYDDVINPESDVVALWKTSTN